MKKRGNSKVDLASKLKLPMKNLVFVPASYFKRSLAFIIDLLIVDLVIISQFRDLFAKLIIDGLTFSTASRYFESNPEILSRLTWIMITVSILVVTYFSVLQFKLRQTLGMMIFNIWVYSEDKNISLWKIVVSNLMLVPVFPFLLLLVLDPMYLAFSKSRQRLMQKFMGIYIIEETEVGYV